MKVALGSGRLPFAKSCTLCLTVAWVKVGTWIQARKQELLHVWDQLPCVFGSTSVVRLWIKAFLNNIIRRFP